MASIGHLATGAFIGAVYARSTGTKPLPAMAGFAALALAPDLDLLTMGFVEADTALDHRVATHAIPPAIVAGCIAAVMVRERAKRAVTGVLFALALMSHGLLDGMTRQGEGTVLLWPFDAVRRSFAWRPIPGASSFHEYFSWGAGSIFWHEGLVFLPVFILTIVVLAVPLRPIPPVATLDPSDLPAGGE